MPKFKRYEKYKDSGIKWIGEVPEHWGIDRLKHYCKVLPSNVDKNFSDKEYQIYLCNYTDVYYNDFIDNNLEFMETTASKSEINKFRLKEEDVIITKDSEDPDDIAVPAYVNKELEDVVCGYHLIILRVSNKSVLQGKYLFWMMNSHNVSSYFSSMASGITRYGIGLNTVKFLNIFLPSLLEQKNIADFLEQKTSEIDSLIADKEKLVEKLQEYKQSLITNTVTKGLDPNVKMKDSGIEWIGEVPEHWELIKLKYLCKINTGSKDTQDRVPDGDYPFFVRSDNVERIDEYTHDQEAVMTSGDGVGVGKVFHHYKGKFSAHQRLYIFTNFHNCIGKFLYYYLKVNLAYEVLKSNAKSTVDSLRMHMLADFFVTIPNLSEQNIIINYLDQKISDIDSLIINIENQIEKLKEYRQSLITHAFTGKIDVRDYFEEGFHDVGSQRENVGRVH